MLNVFANLLLSFAPSVDVEKAQAIPSSLKDWFDGSASNGWREGKGVKCQTLHIFSE